MIVIDRDIPRFIYNAAVDYGRVCLDVETGGLNKQHDKLACIQLYIPGSGEKVIVRNIEKGNLTDLLEDDSIIKVFHHAEFDLFFLIRDFKIFPTNIVCTKILAKLADPAKTRFYDPYKEKSSHSLAALVYAVNGVILNKSVATSNWFAFSLTEEQKKYAMEDVLYLEDVYTMLLDLLTVDKIIIAQAAFDYLPQKIRAEMNYSIKDVYGYA